MWPWGHLAVGYLLYSPSYRIRTGRRPQALPITLLVIGTQISDLIDKPLAYWFTVLPESRSLAHSYLVIVPICLLMIAVLAHVGQSEPAIGFTVGLLSHPIADGFAAIVNGQWTQLSYMIWPMLPVPDYEAASFAYHFQDLRMTFGELSLGMLLNPTSSVFVIEIWLTLLVITLWVIDGFPPLHQTLIRILTLGQQAVPGSRK